MTLKGIAEELSRFTFSQQGASFRWNTHDDELNKALQLLRRAQERLPECWIKRRLRAVQTIITNISEARKEKNTEWLAQLSPAKLQEELQSVGKELLARTKRQGAMTRRQFLRIAGLAAVGALATGTIITIVEPPSRRGRKSFLARLFGRTREREERIKKGYYLQLGAYSTPENAEKAAEELLHEYNALAPFQIVYLPETTGPYKIFIKQSFTTFDDVIALAQQIHKTYPSLEFGIVHIDENGARQWLSTVARETKKRLKQLERAIEEQRLAGLTPQQRRYYPLIQEACERYPTRQGERVNPLLVLAMMEVESTYRPHARSSKGAMGLLQLMPAMWKHFHNKSSRYHGETLMPHECNPYDIEQNIDAGVHMISYLHEKYPPGTPDREGTIIMAYNTGETNLKKGKISKETTDYSDKVRAAKAKFTMINAPNE